MNIRLFRHHKGFGDDTEFVGVVTSTGATFLIMSDGASVPARGYTQADVERLVDEGQWKEIPVA